MLKDRLAQSFQTQIPICLDQFLQELNNYIYIHTNVGINDDLQYLNDKFDQAMLTSVLFTKNYTTASVLNFEAENQLVVLFPEVLVVRCIR